MATLVTIEGFDHSGKDTLLREIEDRGFSTYHQPTADDCGFSYRDTSKFEIALKDHFSKMLSDLEKLTWIQDKIYLTRFIISDNIYSDMFGRSHILEDMLKEHEFKICPFVLVWKDYQDFLDRTSDAIEPEYSKEEFNVIQSKFREYCQMYNGLCCEITNKTTREEILNKFLEFNNGIAD